MTTIILRSQSYNSSKRKYEYYENTYLYVKIKRTFHRLTNACAPLTLASTTVVPRGRPGGMKILSNEALAAASAASSAWLRLSYRARRALDLAWRALGFIRTHYDRKFRENAWRGEERRKTNSWKIGVMLYHSCGDGRRTRAAGI